MFVELCFYPRSSRATDRAPTDNGLQLAFHSRFPCGSDVGLVRKRFAHKISIHASRAGSDRFAFNVSRYTAYFNPRSPCGERRRDAWTESFWYGISIHAPHVGSDKVCRRSVQMRAISSHAPRAGSDASIARLRRKMPRFQSTLPVRGATLATCRRCSTKRFQSTLPMWGATKWRAKARRR